MIDMHDQITGRQALGFGQKVFGPAFAFGLTDQPVAQHILFGHDGDATTLPRPGKPMFQRPNRQI